MLSKPLLKLTTSHLHALINENTNETMLKRILIAMHNENKADFRASGLILMSHRPSVQVVDNNRPVGAELFQLQF